MADWGAIHKATTDGKTPGSGETGEVVQHHPAGGAAVHHETNYDATDSRHGRESAVAGWPSVDSTGGEASPGDLAPRGAFPDGPGVWRQT